MDFPLLPWDQESRDLNSCTYLYKGHAKVFRPMYGWSRIPEPFFSNKFSLGSFFSEVYFSGLEQEINFAWPNIMMESMPMTLMCYSNIHPFQYSRSIHFVTTLTSSTSSSRWSWAPPPQSPVTAGPLSSSTTTRAPTPPRLWGVGQGRGWRSWDRPSPTAGRGLGLPSPWALGVPGALSRLSWRSVSIPSLH